jgi:DNA repair protein RecN (Recombination protein N)
MLQTLRIRNLALLEEVALEFESGFTVVTGETGAGKSILLGALGLLAGERADKTIIRQGAAACEVEASLYFPHPAAIDTLLAELDLPPCEEGQLLLKRSLPREKAPRITVNGSLATLAALQRLGERWIDFHGPSEPRRLLKESCQLELLDLFARNEVELAAYHAAYHAWRELLAERTRLTGETRLSPEQAAFVEKLVDQPAFRQRTFQTAALGGQTFQHSIRCGQPVDQSARSHEPVQGAVGRQGPGQWGVVVDERSEFVRPLNGVVQSQQMDNGVPRRRKGGVAQVAFCELDRRLSSQQSGVGRCQAHSHRRGRKVYQRLGQVHTRSL